MSRIGVALALLLACAAASPAQERQATLIIAVRGPDGPLAGATILAGGAAAVTDEAGAARLTVPAGTISLVIRCNGFIDVALDLTLRPAEARDLPVTLVRAPVVEEEVVVVASTRTGRHADDQPMRVEVLGREEIEEKMLMTPGDIVMMLNEMGGLRVQATSPSLGAASVRIQGMRGRYTRFLSDGLPLFGEQPGGLGLLQIPPMDLGQVEVIKGVASALYGAGAMGGVVNLLSRRPGDALEREVLLNQSTRGATDAVFWLSGPVSGRTGMTFLASGHRQSQTDVDGDGWADLASYSRAVVRPRWFWDDGRGGSLFATAGFTRETRTGGTVDGATLPSTGAAYREALGTTRADAGLVGQAILASRFVLTARAAVASQRHDHVFGEVEERDRHTTIFAEAAVRARSGRHTWVAGWAIEHDRYGSVDVPRFDYAYTTPGVFVQDDVDVRSWLSLSASGRLDWHSEYGALASPRVSALVRGGGWTSRLSYGTGFYGPTALTEETEAAGLARLYLPRPLEAERGRSSTLDVSRAWGPWTWTATAFSSRIDHPVAVDRHDVYQLRNLDGPTTTRGVELLATLRQEPYALTATYTFVRARESDRGLERDVPLTPRHSAGLVAMVESEEWGRVGLEVYVTGRQTLEADPFRSTSEPYVIVGLLAERKLGRLSLFVNGENLTGVRQSRWDRLVRTTRGIDGRWTVDAWAPLEGRVVNGGVRVQFD